MRMMRPWWLALIVCRVVGHNPYRIMGTFYVLCVRCGDVTNLRKTAGRRD